MQTAKHLAITPAAATFLFFVAAAAAHAQTASPSPSPSPSASPSTPAPSPSAAPTEGPLYPVGGEIYTIDREAQAYYYFQENRDGSAKVKQELRYSRNLWNKNAQIGARIPIITRFPVIGDPFAGLGDIELGYRYSVKNPGFDHSLEIRAAFPTAVNGVDNLDTELKGFYTTKWKWKNGLALSYVNEYDQSVIKPPNASWTSYYEGKVTLPDSPFIGALPGLKISAIYNFRVLFDSGGIWKDAAGVTMFGSVKDWALSLIDTWGLGANALWKYKFEANLSTRF